MSVTEKSNRAAVPKKIKSRIGKPKGLTSAGFMDDVERSAALRNVARDNGATPYELEYFFQTGKRLPKAKEDEHHE